MKMFFSFLFAAHRACSAEIQSATHPTEITKRSSLQIETKRPKETEAQNLSTETSRCHGIRRKEGIFLYVYGLIKKSKQERED